MLAAVVLPASSPSCTSTTSAPRAGSRCGTIELVRTRQALMASDHLPLVADLKLTY
ncbi:MAG: hypothetical protein R2708_06105 [Vicinamibacterales bacterium]